VGQQEMDDLVCSIGHLEVSFHNALFRVGFGILLILIHEVEHCVVGDNHLKTLLYGAICETVRKLEDAILCA